MVNRPIFAWATALVWLGMSFPAHAQLLERLEKKLQEAIGGERPLNAANRGVEENERRVYLGVTVDSEAQELGLKVIAIQEGSAAAQAGLQVDDLITGIAGRDVRLVSDMEDALSHAAGSGRIIFDILRDGDPQQLTVMLGTSGGELPAPRVAVAQRPSLGITVAPVTEEARIKQGFPVRKGALISAVKAGGAAARAGLPVGGAVVALDGRRIETPQDLIEAVRTADVGQEVELQYYRGATLHRKKVRLAPEFEPLAPELDRNRSSGPGGRIRDLLGSDLPGVKKLEGLLDRSVLPERVPLANSDDLTSLREEIDLLKQQVEQLSRQVEELHRLREAPKPN